MKFLLCFVEVFQILTEPSNVMGISKSIKSAKKVVRPVKFKAIHVIKWHLADNLCLLYAIWEMCTPTQKDVLSVSCISRRHLLIFKSDKSSAALFR